MGRVSIIERVTTPSGGQQGDGVPHVSALEIPHTSENARRRSISNTEHPDIDIQRDDLSPQALASLTKTVSKIAGNHENDPAIQQEELTTPPKDAGRRKVDFGVSVARPVPVKPGPFDTIHEVPSAWNTPLPSGFNTPANERQTGILSVPSTRPPSPTALLESPPRTSSTQEDFDVEDHTAQGYPDVGTLNSWRGLCICIITCTAQMMDNVFMTGVNISLPAIQRDFGIDDSALQWLISAYTLTFGGFLLLAGVMSDRYGRKNVFVAGMAWLSIWTLADGFASSFIQLAIFRAFQGMGAAMTVPSGVGIISSFFVAQDRTRALSYFAAAGAVGFCLGLVLGGFLTQGLGWRYLFWLTVIITGLLGLAGLFILPKDRNEGHEKPRLDILGAGISTGGLVLLSFVISSGGEYGWHKAFIIALLVVSVALLAVFAYVEKKVRNPIMPLSLWKIPNFAALWIAGFVAYGGYQSILYYAMLMAQEIVHLSAGGTALRLIPMAVVGGGMCMFLGKVMERFNTKYLLLFGLACCTIAPIPCALMEKDDINFWKHIFPTSIVSVIGIGTTYCTITVVALASVPVSAKSLCGGMINTAFQIGSGVGLALASAVVQATETNKGHGLLAQYKVGMWCCAGLAGVGFISSLLGVKSVGVQPVPPATH
ncbi:hypothetical protein KC327_g8971 [Hortaea werneckii]|nr:hypothetical protein KC350_g12174 [Hortaea werneckii]KAI6824360.1 hypothetical protein KC358_g8280 [Hortaea werneckii]KAI6836998.1 hypothetical protein KC342_g4840 [Hortaea werneckii]KAI6912930.1 hypothetical protein KC348_g12551 [Hortaea werneckii]KAI6936495.1 hypothetical protein KC341_g6190 [Hortaea werneckii]